jgi:hypothetical protein
VNAICAETAQWSSLGIARQWIAWIRESVGVAHYVLPAQPTGDQTLVFGGWLKGSVNSPRRGRNKPAQGIALGDRSRRGALALKGRYKLHCLFRESSATFAERKATIRHLLICRYLPDRIPGDATTLFYSTTDPLR